ncbi:MAG: hypothetical protein J3R72DRAFT_490231 [Linnemannia gamsii]|nr:MAG: hypothetical protein J3R72DRAFT_490231 [Linnemannia gamsii]
MVTKTIQRPAGVDSNFATKYLVDETPWNNQWSAYSRAFSLRKVNLMENQLLALLKFDCRSHSSRPLATP